VSIVWQIIYLALYVFMILLLARLVMDYVLMFSPRFRDDLRQGRARSSAAALELLYSPSDPPLKLLRRVIPPLRIGGISLDLGFILLLLIVYVLLNVVGRLF
jgi:YggT family protein